MTLTKEQEKLILDNQKLISFIVNKYKNKAITMKYEDLCSAGNEGLIKAATQYDTSRGTAFSTYAHHVIESHILDAILKEDRIIYVPYSAKEIANKFKEAHKNTGTSIKDFAEKYHYSPILITQSLLDESKLHEASLFYKDLKLQIENMIKELSYLGVSDRDINILKDYYGLNDNELKLREICEKYNISGTRARTIIENLLRKLRYRNRDKEIYLEACEEYDFSSVEK